MLRSENNTVRKTEILNPNIEILNKFQVPNTKLQTNPKYQSQDVIFSPLQGEIKEEFGSWMPFFNGME
jgi:hypothetical protein